MVVEILSVKQLLLEEKLHFCPSDITKEQRCHLVALPSLAVRRKNVK